MSNTNLLFVRASSATVGVAVSVQVYSTTSSFISVAAGVRIINLTLFIKNTRNIYIFK
jgi:hypothetical protein